MKITRRNCVIFASLCQLALAASTTRAQLSQPTNSRSNQEQECLCFSREQLAYCSVTFAQLADGTEFLNAYCPNPLGTRLESIELTVDSDTGEHIVCLHRDREFSDRSKELGVETIFSWAPGQSERNIVQNCQKLICQVHSISHPICTNITRTH